MDKTMTRAQVARVVRPRPVHSYKGNFGRVVIVAGDEHFGGAAIMSATAAVNGGAGLVTVVTDHVNHTALHARLPEAMVCTWDDAMLPVLLAAANVVVVGPGLGDTAAAHVVLRLVMATVSDKQTLIVDGSAIDIIAAQDGPYPHTAQTVWTPHQMEWQRLSGIAIADQTLTLDQAAVAKLPGIVVRKGAPTVTMNGQDAIRNTNGGPAMATGGSGDTLTGIIAAFIAQFGWGMTTVAAAVWTHSAVADEVARDAYVALPTRVSAHLPAFMHELTQESSMEE